MTDMLPLFGETSNLPTKKRCIYNDQQIDELFEECWSVRPYRKGSNPKEPAKKNFIAEVKAGENPNLIIAGVRQLRDNYAVQNQDGEYVPMMSTILSKRQRRWKGGDFNVSSPSGGNSFIDIAVELHGAGSYHDPDPASGGRLR